MVANPLATQTDWMIAIWRMQQLPMSGRYLTRDSRRKRLAYGSSPQRAIDGKKVMHDDPKVEGFGAWSTQRG
ncbi:hypothetical protein GCM10023319_19990 [Nocardia iowensis]